MDPASLSAVLVGGYHGRWVRPAAHALSPVGPPARTVRPGAGVIHALGTDACGIQATAGIVSYLAGQCLPAGSVCSLPARRILLHAIIFYT